MKKNIFEEIYEKVQEANEVYDAATDEAGKKEASAIHKEAMKRLESLSEIELQIWRDYESSRDRRNEVLDIRDNYTEREDAVREMVDCLRENGITEFTFSSTWGGAVETAWFFQNAGCTLAGLVEINSVYKKYRSDEYEKAHAYLFKAN